MTVVSQKSFEAVNQTKLSLETKPINRVHSLNARIVTFDKYGSPGFPYPTALHLGALSQ